MKRKVYIFGKTFATAEPLLGNEGRCVQKKTAPGVSKDFVACLLTLLLQKWPTFCL